MLRHRFALLVSSLVLVTACAQPVRPLREPVLMTLTLSATSGDPAHPITARVVLTNIGREVLHFTVPCFGPGYGPVVRDPERKNIVDVCTECAGTVACPACAPGIVVLAPGQSLEASYEYAGTLYDCDGPYTGSAGTYTVEAGTLYTLAGGTVDSVSTSATFSWSTTASR